MKVAPLVLLVLAFAGSAGGAAVPQPVQHTRDPVTALAMDGSRVAYAVQQTGRCPRVLVWTAPRGGTVQLSGKATCGPGPTSTGAGVVQLALAGTRAAWVSNFGGNTESNDILLTAALPRPRETVLSRAARTGDVDGILVGNWLGGTAGDGTLLVASRWRTDASGAIVVGDLRRVVGASTRLVAHRVEAVVSRSVDAGRVAVVREAGDVGIYTAAGAAVTSVQPSSTRAVGLAGGRLAVLTKERTVEVYDARTGALVRTWAVAAGASAFLDVSGNVAVYVAWRTLHALRLDTGRDVALARQPRAIVAAQIEPAGVTYAWNGFARGRFVGNVAFVPAGVVTRAAGPGARL